MKKKQPLSPFALVSILLFILIGIIYTISNVYPSFADLINSTISQDFRKLLASSSNAFSFSLFEVIIICLPIIIFIVIYLAIKSFNKKMGGRFIVNICAFVLLIYSGHLLALGVGYMTTPISNKMELLEVQVNEENLSETLIDLRDELNELSAIVSRNDDGVFDPMYSYEELSGEICSSYNNLAEKYPLTEGFDSVAKEVYFGNVMSYLGITGIYTYVTGEANVNGTYPAYVSIFTAAHEMCHQRGILRENEANFVAYLITSTSEHEALRYSAALNMYTYFANALYKTNKELYYSIASELSEAVRVDMRASSAVSDKYGDTILEKISEKINDIYLETSGSEGVMSYSRVVELVLAYRQTNQ